MTRPRLDILCTALLTITSLTTLACDSPNVDTPSVDTPSVDTPSVDTPVAASADLAETATPAERPAPVAVATLVATPIATPVAIGIDEQPVLASAVAPIAKPTSPETGAKTRSPRAMRSPSLLPAGTPETHVEAFTNLRLGNQDKAPVGGVGASGIHLDELEVGKGWASSRCDQIGTQFVVDADERVNVCFRVIHPREAEAVTLEWARGGKVRQSIQVSVKPTHAYTTRAWLPVTTGRAGDWTATIKSDDGSVLGQVAFQIAGSTETRAASAPDR